LVAGPATRARAFYPPFPACRGGAGGGAATPPPTTVIRREWLEPGMHVISVGGRPDDEARARFDRTLRLGTAPAPVGHPELGIAHEFLGYLARPQDAAWRAMKAGRAAPVVTGRGDDVMYADVVEGRCPGRTRDDQVTYSERGNIQGAQFHAVAGAVYEQARCRGLGRELPAEWFLQDVRD